MWIAGRHPVEELLASARQKPRRLLLAEPVSEGGKKGIAARAAELGIPVLSCPREEWERRTGDRGGPGIAVELEEFRYADLQEWLEGIPENALAFLLDGITDPHNLGAILRNARAFGIAGVIVPKDRSCPVTGAVFRASAGAAAHVPVVLVTNLARTAETLQESGFWLYAALEDGDTDLAAMKPARRTAIVLGSEEHGIRKLVLAKCDGSVRIAMEPGVDSLNVGVTSGILGFQLRSLLPK